MTNEQFAQDGFLVLQCAAALTDEALELFDRESRALQHLLVLDDNAYGAGPPEWRQHETGKVRYPVEVPFYYSGVHGDFDLEKVFTPALLDLLKRVQRIGPTKQNTQVQYTYTLTKKRDQEQRPKARRHDSTKDQLNRHFDSGNTDLGLIYRQHCLIGVCLDGGPNTDAGNFLVWPGSHEKLRSELKNRWEAIPSDLNWKEKLKKYSDWKSQSMGAVEGDSHQIQNTRNQAVICHQLLLHGTTENRSEKDRRMVFFRIGIRSITGTKDQPAQTFPDGAALWEEPVWS
jgi:hypothetical protein